MKTAKDKNAGFREIVLNGIKTPQTASFGFRMLPMIDVLFLLLIFFILTAQFRPQESILPFQLPGSSAQAAVGTVDPLTITLAPALQGVVVHMGNRNVAVSEKSMEENLAGVVEELAGILKSQKRNPSDPVEFVCDKRIKWLYVAKLYNVLYGMGVCNITFQMTD
jgi:biopolymer transport protein ExbD